MNTISKLTIGSIIRFNNKKCMVTHTHIPYGNRDYKRGFNHTTIDITKGSCGYLKDLNTNKEFSADWSNITSDKILYYEEFEK